MVNGDAEKRPWAAADQLWANTGLKPAEFSAPVLGLIFLPPEARFSHLPNLTEGDNIGKALNEAMKLTEQENTDLKGALPRPATRTKR